MVTMDH